MCSVDRQGGVRRKTASAYPISRPQTTKGSQAFPTGSCMCPSPYTFQTTKASASSNFLHSSQNSASRMFLVLPPKQMQIRECKCEQEDPVGKVNEHWV